MTDAVAHNHKRGQLIRTANKRQMAVTGKK